MFAPERSPLQQARNMKHVLSRADHWKRIISWREQKCEKFNWFLLPVALLSLLFAEHTKNKGGDRALLHTYAARRLTAVCLRFCALRESHNEEKCKAGPQEWMTFNRTNNNKRPHKNQRRISRSRAQDVLSTEKFHDFGFDIGRHCASFFCEESIFIASPHLIR